MGAGSRARRGVALAAAALLLVACGSSAEPDDGAAGSAPPPPVSATPSPALTDADGRELTEDEARAFREATDVVVAYEQTFYDILAEAPPGLDRMSLVAVQPQLDLDVRSLQRIVVDGDYSIDSTGATILVEALPYSVDLSADRPEVVLEACVDQTAFAGTQGGTTWTGPRERARYRVVKAVHLAPPQWAVANVAPPSGSDQPQPC
jgi:hypothetical protein